MPSMESHPRWCGFIFAPQIPPIHVEHENTLLLVCFRVPCLSNTLDTSSPFPMNTLYTCRTQKDTLVGVFSCSALFLCPTTHAEHKKTPLLVSFNKGVFQQGCLFVFGVVPLPCNTYAKHKMTPLLVSFCAWIPFYAFEWALRAFIKYFMYY